MNISFSILIITILVVLEQCYSFAPIKSPMIRNKINPINCPQQSPSVAHRSFGESLLRNRREPLKDILGLGFPEIALALVAALVLFGPETMKSLSKDVGKAAAELKEIPKTFKEGMEEGAESVEVAKMKAIAAEKRKKRDEKLAAQNDEEEEGESDKKAE